MQKHSHCITEGNFIADFKKAEVRPLYKSNGRADKSVSDKSDI